MTDPDRLEKALPDLLRRSGWTEPEAQIPLESVSLEEQQRWEQLFEEPAEPVRKRFGGLSLLGASGLVAAALIAAVSFRSVLQSSSQLKTAPSQTATEKSVGNGYVATRPKVAKRKPSEFALPEKEIPRQSALPAQPAPKTSAPTERSPSKPTIAPESDSLEKGEETVAKVETKTYPVKKDSYPQNQSTPANRRADPPDNTIASKSETKTDAVPLKDDLEDKATIPRPAMGIAPKPSPPAAGAITSQAPHLFLVSAPDLDATVRDRFQQQLNRTRLQSTTAGEVVFDLKVQDGRVSEATFVENASSLKDASMIEAIKQALQEVKLLQVSNSITRVTVRVERVE